MKKSAKVMAVMLIIIMSISILSNTAFAAISIPTATSNFYVNDFANVFSEAEKEILMDNAVALSEQYDGTQVVVTTIESLDGNTIEDYALEMYNQYGIGKDDMGLLVLLSTGDREIRVQVGKAMEVYINDSKAGRFLDQYAIPYLAENQFAEGLINLQEALISEISDQLNTEATTSLPTTTPETSSNFNIFLVFEILFGICLVVVVLCFIYKAVLKSNEMKSTIEELNRELEEAKKELNAAQEMAERDKATIESQYSQYLDSAKTNIDNLKNEILSLKRRNSTLQDEFDKLQDKYRRVQILYPTADQDVLNMIKEEIRQKDLKLAAEVDSIIQGVINKQPDKDLLENVRKAVLAYSKLNHRQKGYIKSDISRLDKLYADCLRLSEEYAKQLEEERNKKAALQATESIIAIISGISIGREENLEALRRANSIFRNLSSGSLRYFDSSISEKLDRLMKQAIHDKEKREEEERRIEEKRRQRRRMEEERRRREEEERRRRHRMDSSSNFGGGSHFGGFGGSSGGGGASRRF